MRNKGKGGERSKETAGGSAGGEGGSEGSPVRALLPEATLTFRVYGDPVPKARPRARAFPLKGGGAMASVYTPASSKKYEKAVAGAAAQAVVESDWSYSKDNRYALNIIVNRRHANKGGDWDNYAKSICDACNGILWDDDRHIVSGHVEVFGPTAEPYVEIVVRRFGCLKQSGR